ncbi:hypothetical protein [Paracoccus pacificus]|uniref:Lipoprotein n=1 Tax=Paracoccus pacificus TaxID=1463598 RepID=A0ABW4RBJ4_9RHOB
MGMPFLRDVLRPFVWLFVLSGALALAGCGAPVSTTASVDSAAAPAAAANSVERVAMESSLGTQWGEGVESRARTVDLRRQSNEPLAVSTLRYAATAYRGEPVREIPIANGRVGLRVLRANGTPWPITRAAGIDHLQGRVGESYILEYRNYSTSNTYEIVTTVDGLDVLNGRPGSFRNRGHVLRPGQSVRIAGFRKSQAEIAVFRFSNPADSYAANSAAGSRANVGVIGTAVFALIDRAAALPPGPRPCMERPCAFPDAPRGDQPGYAPPPAYAD